MYDVIIIGAGTAGCVAARELAEKQNKKASVWMLSLFGRAEWFRCHL